MIEIVRLSKAFGELRVLDGISFGVDKAQVVVVLGPSGSGKSTMLRCVSLHESYDGGEVRIEGQRVGYRVNGRGQRVPRSEVGNAHHSQQVGMVSQSFNLFPTKTALENVMMGPLHARRQTKAEALEIGRSLLAKVGLSDKSDKYPIRLSGGQQQRVAIARALAMHPKVMLFDEVTSALDPELVGEVLIVIRELAREGMTMIVVTHEIPFARDVADRIIFMDKGRIVEEGAPGQVLSMPASPRLRLFLRRYQGD